MSNEPLAREREPIERVRLALRHWLGRTPLPAAGLADGGVSCRPLALVGQNEVIA
jgi:hypothetical protein